MTNRRLVVVLGILLGLLVIAGVVLAAPQQQISVSEATTLQTGNPGWTNQPISPTKLELRLQKSGFTITKAKDQAEGIMSLSAAQTVKATSGVTFTPAFTVNLPIVCRKYPCIPEFLDWPGWLDGSTEVYVWIFDCGCQSSSYCGQEGIADWIQFEVAMSPDGPWTDYSSGLNYGLGAFIAPYGDYYLRARNAWSDGSVGPWSPVRYLRIFYARHESDVEIGYKQVSEGWQIDLTSTVVFTQNWTRLKMLNDGWDSHIVKAPAGSFPISDTVWTSGNYALDVPPGGKLKVTVVWSTTFSFLDAIHFGYESYWTREDMIRPTTIGYGLCFGGANCY